MSLPYNQHTTATEVASDLSSNIRGKTILTTGVTPNSLGAHFVQTLAAHEPKLLILATRSLDTANATAKAIAEQHPDVQTRALELDLGSLASVRRAAAEVNRWREEEGVVVDVLMLNAGVMACPYGTTTDGFERQFGTNHVGHFLFGNLIVPGMLGEGRRPRVVVVSSMGHVMGPIRFADIGFKNGERYHKWRAYGQAKTANMLYALSLAEKLGPKGLLAFSLHPGGINTNLGRHIDLDVDNEDWKSMLKAFTDLGNPHGENEYWQEHPFKTIDEGTSTHVVAAFADGLEKDNGKYLTDANIAPSEEVRAWARDPIDAERLWKLTEELVGQKFDF